MTTDTLASSQNLHIVYFEDSLAWFQPTCKHLEKKQLRQKTKTDNLKMKMPVKIFRVKSLIQDIPANSPILNNAVFRGSTG